MATVEFAPGSLFDGTYRIERVLGEGTMGVALLALDTSLQRRVCLKVSTRVSSANRTEELRREASALASLRSHHVPLVHSFGVHEGHPYFVMEYVDGEDLRSILSLYQGEHATQAPAYRALDILRQVADGLAAVHAVGLVHRDVKPDNVVIERDSGRAVLVDFGLVAFATEPAVANILAGTPDYFPPEYLATPPAAPSPLSDIYSFGCTAFELLTGRAPLSRDSVETTLLAHMQDEVPVLSELRADLPFLDATIARMLEKNPERRFETCAAIAAIFSQHLTTTLAFSSGETTSPKLPTGAADAADGTIRVLVVDDDPVFGRVAARCAQLALADARVSVSRSGTGREALANAQRRRPDLIILDYNLPDLNGVEVLARLRNTADGRHAHVIVASGSVGASDRWRFGIFGVKDFLAKPAEIPAITDRLVAIAKERGWM